MRIFALGVLLLELLVAWNCQPETQHRELVGISSLKSELGAKAMVAKFWSLLETLLTLSVTAATLISKQVFQAGSTAMVVR
jgi:hypothetical protein